MFQHLASCICRYCIHDLKEALDVAITLESRWIPCISGKIGRFMFPVPSQFLHFMYVSY